MRFDKLEFDRSSNRASGKGQEADLPINKDEKYWSGLADEHRRNGNYEMALRFYSRALELDKAIVLAWVGQVQMLVQLGEYPQASLWSQKALELFPTHAELMAGQAQAECRMGNFTKAHAMSDGALRQRGESAYRWQVRGELLVATKANTDRHCFDKAHMTDPDWLVSMESSLIYGHYKAFSMAQHWARMAVEKAPQAYQAWYVLGHCENQLGFVAASRRSLARCLELCPQHASASAELIEIDGPQFPLVRFIKRLWGRS